MTFNQFDGTAEQYIREYLDPDGVLYDSPTTEEEARKRWEALEDCFRDDGGAGIDEETFVAAVKAIQIRLF